MSNNVGVEGTLPVVYLPKYCTGYWVYCVRAVRYIPQPVSKQRTCPCSVLPTRSHSSLVTREKGSPLFPTTTAFPPLSLPLSSPPNTTQTRSHTICPYNSGTAYPHHPKSTISPFLLAPILDTTTTIILPSFFSTLIGLDSVILSSSMLFFHSRDHDLSHGRATTHLCLLEHPPLT